MTDNNDERITNLSHWITAFKTSNELEIFIKQHIESILPQIKFTFKQPKNTKYALRNDFDFTLSMSHYLKTYEVSQQLKQKFPSYNTKFVEAGHYVANIINLSTQKLNEYLDELEQIKQQILKLDPNSLLNDDENLKNSHTVLVEPNLIIADTKLIFKKAKSNDRCLGILDTTKHILYYKQDNKEEVLDLNTLLPIPVVIAPTDNKINNIYLQEGITLDLLENPIKYIFYLTENERISLKIFFELSLLFTSADSIKNADRDRLKEVMLAKNEKLINKKRVVANSDDKFYYFTQPDLNLLLICKQINYIHQLCSLIRQWDHTDTNSNNYNTILNELKTWLTTDYETIVYNTPNAPSFDLSFIATDSDYFILDLNQTEQTNKANHNHRL